MCNKIPKINNFANFSLLIGITISYSGLWYFYYENQKLISENKWMKKCLDNYKNFIKMKIKQFKKIENLNKTYYNFKNVYTYN